MKRRKFLQHSCNLCLLGSAGFLLPQLTGCSASKYAVYKTTITNNTVQVPLNLFATSPLQFIRPTGLYKDIAVQQKDAATYAALLLECTHQENGLTPTGNGYRCSLHGSEFDKDGKVRKGPAELPLVKFTTTIENDNLLIHLK